MARYIDADTLYVNIKAECNPYGKPTINFDDGCKVLDMIRRAPTADVQPVVHAHWTIIYESTAGVTDAKCSNCGYESLAYENDVHTDENCNYCPRCGAKMDEVVE